MNTVRRLLPTDLPLLATSQGLGALNLAYPRERLGADPQRSLSILRDQVAALARQRTAAISLERQHLRGLIGTRPRGGGAAWEVDYLLDATPDGVVTAELLDYAVSQAGKEGAEKLFLRLPADSEALRTARKNEFLPYQEEALFAGDLPLPPSSAPEGMRHAAASDSYPLFRLYCAAFPESVRRLEAATFDEWHAAQEQRWQKGGVCLVIERDAAIQAQVRACRLPQGVMLELLAASRATADVLPLISAATEATRQPDGPVFLLLPGALAEVANTLLAAGFNPHQEYVSLVRRTTKPITLPREVPAVAKHAIGV